MPISAVIQCQACAFQDFIDEEPAWGWISGTVFWGQNMIDGIVDESMLSGYDVWLVDACGEQRAHAGYVLKRTYSDQISCCAADAYNLTFGATAIGEDR